MLVSPKVNLTTTRVSLICKNGLLCMSHLVSPGKSLKILQLLNFVYGCLDIVDSEPPKKQAVLTQHLMSFMRLASKYNWPAVLSFHATVLDRIQARLANWGDDFSEIERFNITESQRLPNITPSANNTIVPGPSNRSLALVTKPVTSRVWNTSALTANSLNILLHLVLLDHPLLQTVLHHPRLID